jgi:hypothetical protein
MAAAKTGVILLGGVNMTQRHLGKIASALYPSLCVHSRPHSVVQLVNVRYSFPKREDELRRSLDAFPDGCVVHSVSGSAYFVTAALSKWKDERVRGIILDSVPQVRLEASLLRLLGMPAPLVKPAAALTRAVLVSPLFDATLEYTDRYSAITRDPGQLGAPRVLYAHSEEDEVVPVQQFQDFWGQVKKDQVNVECYLGKGKHAAMARDDVGFRAKVQEFLASAGLANGM